MNTGTPHLDHPVAGRYHIVSRVAAIGPMRLERAVDLETNQYVLLARYLAPAGEAPRIRRAVMVAGTFAHPRLAGLLDAGESADGCYQVYTYIPGRLLAELIHDKAPAPAAEALPLALEIAGGLRALHEAGLVHGALAPENIVVGWDGEVRLTAYIAPDGGTPTAGAEPRPWLAPELRAGAAATVASDIFAAGSLLAALIDQTAAPEPVRALIARARADDPAARYRSARALEAAIAGAAATLGAPHDAPPPLPAAPAEPAATMRAATSAPPAPEPELPAAAYLPYVPPPPTTAVARPSARRPSPLAAAGLALAAVLVLALAVGAIITSSMDGSDERRAAVAGVSEEGLPPPPSLPDTTLAGEPEIVDEPSVDTRERDLLVHRARLSGADEPIPPLSAPDTVDEREAEAEPAARTPAPAAPTATATPTPTPTPTPRPALVLAFEVTDWEGAWPRTDDGFLGRPWISLYGSRSGYGEATLTFTLEEAPSGAATLRLVGVDDQSDEESRLEIRVNGRRIFGGDSPFPKWDGESSTAPWTPYDVAIPASVLRPGENTIVLTNTNRSANFGKPPYILISHASLTIE